MAHRKADFALAEGNLNFFATLFHQLVKLVDGFAWNDDTGNRLGAFGQAYFHPCEAMPIRRNRAQHRRTLVIRGMQIDPVQVVARFLRRNREACFFKQRLAFRRSDMEFMAKVSLGHDGKIIDRQACQREFRLTGRNGQFAFVTLRELNVRSIAQFTDNLIEHVRRHGGRAFFRHFG